MLMILKLLLNTQTIYMILTEILTMNTIEIAKFIKFITKIKSKNNRIIYSRWKTKLYTLINNENPKKTGASTNWN